MLTKIGTKLNKNNKYRDQIEYRTLTLTLMQNQSFLTILLPISQYILLSPLFQSQEALILVIFQLYSLS